VEKINQKFTRGFYDGAKCFDAFRAIQRQLSVEAKQFVAVISVEKSTLKSGQDVRAVHAAQVKSVVPLLKDKSLCRDEKCRIYSRMHIELGSRRK
jgi:hypothetical protein